MGIIREIFKKRTKNRRNQVFIAAFCGGGLRGYFSAQVAKFIEDEFKIRFSNWFDLFAGTSAGALSTSVFASDFSANQAVDLYETYAKKIFTKKSKLVNGLNRSIYDINNLKESLQDIFGNAKLCTLNKKILITATNISKGDLCIFDNSDKTTTIAEAATASSAAPIYFEAFKIGDSFYSDGGLWANDPSLLALSEVCKGNNIESLTEVFILSIGTGLIDLECFTQNIIKKRKDEKITKLDLGLAHWGTNILNCFSGYDEIGDRRIIRNLMPAKNYLKIDFDITPEFSKIDDIQMMPKLRLKAAEVFAEYKPLIQEFLEQKN